MSASAARGDLAGADSVAAFYAAVDDALARGTPEAIPDQSLQRMLSAAVRLYAAKSEDRAQELAPFGDRPVNATEASGRRSADHAKPTQMSGASRRP